MTGEEKAVRFSSANWFAIFPLFLANIAQNKHGTCFYISLNKLFYRIER